MSTNKQANRLIHEKSPYLLQHAHNPVNWYPWCDEAFEKAKSEDKPIFLSIGYSTCHWCHVMERESFEDEEVADILNKNFICIKVDREERPDIDNIYMTACQALTGHGGWPLTIIMAPDKRPFFAGTYFPKKDRMGMRGLVSILNSVHDTWVNEKDALDRFSTQIVNAISESIDDGSYNSIDEISEDIFEDAFSQFKYDFDNIHGGFGSAPKFPTPHNLYFLLRYWHKTKDEYALNMVEKTLNSMYSGGIYDHIGFGFSRYSTDKKWLVPHFEKMLYDNALLAIAYLETYQATRDEKYADIAKQIFTYVLRDMTSPEGGFYSAEDADSEGEEGKFYVWSPDEIKEILGDSDGEKYCKYYNITEEGNFEGLNILNLINSTISDEDMEFAESCRQKLFEYREKRVHPHKDDKILTSWNGLMIAAMAIGGRVLGIEKYSLAAEKAAEFIFSRLVRSDGRLLARYRDGEAAFLAYVDDYAFLVWGLIELYETTYRPQYLKKALKLNNDLIKYFWDNEKGGLFIYGSDNEQLITRPKEIYDGATPSGNSVAVLNFLRLARLTGQQELEEKAHQMFSLFGSKVGSMPRGYAFFLTAMLFSQSKTKEVVLVGDSHKDTQNMLNIISEDFRPFTTSILYSEEHKDIKELVPFIDNYTAVEGKTTAYICENFTCQSPIIDSNQFREKLNN
ncbi:thioredoxin domain-containing protein [Acetivibrio mesophilus]|uniref:Thioredoxin domain-containing protein n=1 Tax=Acetivibrio mesophilus TaxID=2487273 RepID=A0A4Q0I5E1_9FIRM|nr:thioredoxin domain-containing protein [Acetivibrio mesophilus]RXE59550.1 thioredoxin domain-containing protein [Acetivibrio mesophilus]HHV30760.1 thioredoxin domain-containing protein [Clostridium sp.]